MVEIAFFVFLIHGILMLVDEIVFHRRRQVPAWERIGHPIDTLSVFLPLVLVWFASPTSGMTTLFVILAVISSLLVTKDEFVHKQYCENGELYLHALLFLLHPLLFFSAWTIWPHLHSAEGASHLPVLYLIVLLSVLGFGMYQLVYWNVFEPAKKQGKDFY